MNRVASTARPDWVSDDLFPFESRFLDLPPDHRMHYIDEGEGEPIVFVHGNPAWSFEFRHPVRELRSAYRCVALDHIGFGLSSRSARREDHRPQSHAHRLAALLAQSAGTSLIGVLEEPFEEIVELFHVGLCETKSIVPKLLVVRHDVEVRVI